MKTALAIGLFWALSIGCAGAHDIEVSTGVVCNTQKQVEEFAAFNESAPQAAIRDVNDEERDPTACTVASLAFIRGHRATTMRTSRATFQQASDRVRVRTMPAYGRSPKSAARDSDSCPGIP